MEKNGQSQISGWNQNLRKGYPHSPGDQSQTKWKFALIAPAISCGASIIGMGPIGSRNPTHFQSAWDLLP
jgi:hypothetical protein